MMHTKQTMTFLALTFFGGWSMAFYILFTGGTSNPSYEGMQMMVMLIPPLAAIFTLRATKERLSDTLIRPRFLGHVLAYVMAWFAPQVMVFAGVCVYYFFLPGHFDIEMGQFGQMLAQQAQEAQYAGEITADVIQTAAFSQLFIGIFLAPLFNIIFGFFQEFGWRGYLFPKLCQRFSNKIAMLLSSAAWGLWYAPLVLMGYTYGTNYQGFPWLGIVAMVFYCMAFGMFLSYLTLRAQSVIPAALAAGGMNGVASLGMILYRGDPTPFMGPEPTGILGGIGVLVVGVICFLVADRYAFPGSVAEKQKNIS